MANQYQQLIKKESYHLLSYIFACVTAGLMTSVMLEGFWFHSCQPMFRIYSGDMVLIPVTRWYQLCNKTTKFSKNCNAFSSPHQLLVLLLMVFTKTNQRFMMYKILSALILCCRLCYLPGSKDSKPCRCMILEVALLLYCILIVLNLQPQTFVLLVLSFTLSFL